MAPVSKWNVLNMGAHMSTKEHLTTCPLQRDLCPLAVLAMKAFLTMPAQPLGQELYVEQRQSSDCLSRERSASFSLVRW